MNLSNIYTGVLSFPCGPSVGDLSFASHTGRFISSTGLRSWTCLFCLILNDITTDVFEIYTMWFEFYLVIQGRKSSSGFVSDSRLSQSKYSWPRDAGDCCCLLVKRDWLDYVLCTSPRQRGLKLVSSLSFSHSCLAANDSSFSVSLVELSIQSISETNRPDSPQVQKSNTFGLYVPLGRWC